MSSGSGTDGGSGSGNGAKTEWPQSLKTFANKCFSASNDLNRKAVQEELRALIYKSYTEGTINTIDWDHAQLKSLGGNTNVTKGGLNGKQKKRPALSGNSELLAEREKKEKRARRFDREREEFDRTEQEGLYAITPAQQNGSLADRLGVNNGTTGAIKPLMNINRHRQQNVVPPSASVPIHYGVSPSTGASNYDTVGSWQNQAGRQSNGINAALFVGVDAADPVSDVCCISEAGDKTELISSLILSRRTSSIGIRILLSGYRPSWKNHTYV